MSVTLRQIHRPNQRLIDNFCELWQKEDDGEPEEGEAGTVLATITINKQTEVKTQMCKHASVCVCVFSGHVTCGKEAVCLRCCPVRAGAPEGTFQKE